MKKSFHLIVIMAVICLIAPSTAYAQFTGGSTNTWIIWVIVGVFVAVNVPLFLYRKRKIIARIIRALKGSFYIKGDVTTLESKKILTGAIYSHQQGACLNTLTTGIDTEKRNTTLGEWWSITDAYTAVDTLDYLRDKGYGYYFPTVCKAAAASSDEQRKEIIINAMSTQEDAQKAYTQAHNLLESIEVLKKENVIETADDIMKYGVAGWDAGRLVYIARLCYDAKYIDEAEAWRYIDVAYAQAQSALGSWEELAKSYIIGRYVWGGSDIAGDGMVHLADELLKKPNSPWNMVKWK